MKKKMMNRIHQMEIKLKTRLKMIKIMMNQKTTRIQQPRMTTRLTHKTKKRMQDGYKKVFYKEVMIKGL